MYTQFDSGPAGRQLSGNTYLISLQFKETKKTYTKKRKKKNKLATVLEKVQIIIFLKSKSLCLLLMVLILRSVLKLVLNCRY